MSTSRVQDLPAPVPLPGEIAAPAKADPMPPGLHNVYVFDIFNTTSWMVVLGSPMLLFLQHLNATATVLAIAYSLSPVLNILQIPAARFVERVGYRRFVLGGWTTRSFFVVGMTVVAFLPDTVDRTTRIVLMLFLSLAYNTMRGISACGLLPWFTHIVPESRRGEFLAKDQSAVAFSGIVSLFACSLLFAGGRAWYSFGLVFSVSAIAAFISLFFLRRVPDVPVEKIVQNVNPLPWREMFFYPPFFAYIRYNIVVNTALGASAAFWVRYLRSFLHVSDSHVLLIACATSAVLALALFLVTPVIDRTGNKQVLALSNVVWIAHFVGWGSIAGGLLPFNSFTVGLQIFTGGFAAAMWNLANVRAVMSIAPVMGRAHFLALYSVAANLTVGVIPLVWGPVMDLLETWQVKWGWWHWNTYSLLYTVFTSTMVLSLVFLRGIKEPDMMTWDVFMHELLVQTPSRAVSRLLGRLRGPAIQ